MLKINGRTGAGRIFERYGNNAHNLLGLDFIDKLAYGTWPRCVTTSDGSLASTSPLRNAPNQSPFSTRGNAIRSRLENQGVVTKVDYSRWAAPIVVLKKASGNLRFCADFSTGLSDALELHKYPLPLPEDIFVTLNGGCYFSQIDFADAYLQVEVDDASQELLTINTHKGFSRYNRLSFGVKSAPGIFQQIVDTMLARIKGAVAYLDDVITVGRTEEEHFANLDAVYQGIRIPHQSREAQISSSLLPSNILVS
uniref:Reverse transcriptase domain-containing protein n=1 Tax=Ascaris lumbricoides TaxID=6252 RepID=A0A0M3ISN1_ASCLU